MNSEKIHALLSLGRKGHLLEIGKTPVEILLKRRRAAMIIVAFDAADNFKQRMEIECRRQNVPLVLFGSKSELGKICGRDEVTIIGISDKNLAKGIKAALD